jgi:uncharacterized protein (TIGR03084 family)
MTNPLATVVTDLADEHVALDAIMAGLADPDWERPTPCEGWRVRDQIAHLAFFDDTSALAIVDAPRFQDEVAKAFSDIAGYEKSYIERGRSIPVERLLAWWRAARQALLAALGAANGQARLPWYGVTMSPVSFVTARLMETWSHGQDVADALGIERAHTDRLRHVAFLGARTRANAYTARGLAPRTEPIRIELVLPSGVPWLDGDERAENRVVGPAVDFCLVVTQRRHVLDTALRVEGAAAEEWMRIAQAFAGPPGPGRKAGQFRRH